MLKRTPLRSSEQLTLPYCRGFFESTIGGQRASHSAYLVNGSIGIRTGDFPESLSLSFSVLNSIISTFSFCEIINLVGCSFH